MEFRGLPRSRVPRGSPALAFLLHSCASYCCFAHLRKPASCTAAMDEACTSTRIPCLKRSPLLQLSELSCRCSPRSRAHRGLWGRESPRGRGGGRPGVFTPLDQGAGGLHHWDQPKNDSAPRQPVPMCVPMGLNTLKVGPLVGVGACGA